MKHYFATMTDREVMCFVNKFRQLLSAGKMAKLEMDCESGCARVNLEVLFQPSYHPHPQEQQQPCRQAQVHRRTGPARQHRRLRRAQAREAAGQANTEQVRPNLSKAPPNFVEKAASHQLPPHTVEEPVPYHQPQLTVAEPVPHHQPPHTVEEPVPHHQPQHTVEEPVPQHTVEEPVHHQPPHTVEEPVSHNQPQLTVEETVPHHQPPHTVEEPVPHHQPQHTVEEPVHHQPPHTVEEPVPHKPPNPVHHAAKEIVNNYDAIYPFGRVAEGFPPLSYTSKEVFLPPAAAPHQVLPVWPSHYQDMDHQGDVSPFPQVQPNHHPPSPPLSVPSHFPSWPGHYHHQSPHCNPSSAIRTPSEPQFTDERWLYSDLKTYGQQAHQTEKLNGIVQKKGKQKSKKKRRNKGQLEDCSEAPISMEPAAVAKYKADCEAYLMKEYGDYYHQAKAQGLL